MKPEAKNPEVQDDDDPFFKASDAKDDTDNKQVGKVATLAVVADTDVNPFVSSVSIGDLGGEDD